MNSTLELDRPRPEPLPNIDDVIPVGEEDRSCLIEVRDVLKRHGRLDRFGMALLHEHFPLAEGEALVEYSDPIGRVLTIKPVKQVEAGNAVGTIWRLHDGEVTDPVLGCMQYCGKDVHGNHGSFHQMR